MLRAFGSVDPRGAAQRGRLTLIVVKTEAIPRPPRLDQFRGRRFGRAIAAALLVLLGATLMSAGHAGPTPRPAALTTVRLALQWHPQSQFAGYYMAREQGIYRAFGLDVQLIHASAKPSALDLLRAGVVDLATGFLADAIMAADAPVAEPSGDARTVAQISQLVQRSSLMLIAWRDMGVNTARDLDGMRVSHWEGGFSTAFEAFFVRHGVDPLRIPQYDSINLFLERGVAACAAMEYNEYHAVWQSGVDRDRLTTFLMREEGFDFPEDGIYGMAHWVAAHPEIARAVREATLAGWDYARTHPEETLDHVLSEAALAGIPANRPHERWMLDHLTAGIFPSDETASAPGALDRDSFTRTARALVEAGFIERIPDFRAFAPLEGRAP